MANSIQFAPRALRRRQLVPIEVTPYEQHVLIAALESRATFAAGNSETIEVADLVRSRCRAAGGRPMMRFARRPQITWGPLPSLRQRRNWCGLCRRHAGPLFDIPDSVWLHYVGAEQRHQILCIRCWHWLTDVIDGSAFEREHGGAVALWSVEFRRRHGIPPNEPSPLDGSTETQAAPS